MFLVIIDLLIDVLNEMNIKRLIDEYYMSVMLLLLLLLCVVVGAGDP